MLYFSELSGKRVLTENGTHLGKLEDLIFLAEAQPAITKLVVSGKTQTPYLIPVSSLTRMNSAVTVSDSFTIEPLAENELYVNKNILDQQIIDIKGNKVVRVNDVAIQDKPALIIAGVDIGIVGILRWFGAEETFGRALRILGKTVTSRFLSWADIQPLELARGKVVLKKEEKKLSRLKPEDLADHLETLSIRNATRMLDIMDDSLAADVVENLNTSYQQNLFKVFTPQRSSKLIARMEADEGVDILLSLTEKRRAEILTLLTQEKQNEIRQLLSLSSTPIGELINNKYFTARTDETAVKIRQRVQKETDDFSSIFYIYAVNRDNQLVGVANLHELLLQHNDSPLYRFMNPSLIVLHMTTPVDIAMKRMFKYKLDALPVIDDNKKMLGVVSLDDLSDVILKKFH